MPNSSFPKLPQTLRDEDLLAFKERFGLTAPSKFVSYTDLGLGYGPDWCHVSTKVHALLHGGRRVHGWSCWLFPQGLMAEFHSVWEDKRGRLIDLTPPKFGSKQVLFVRDASSTICDLGDEFLIPTNRMSPPNDKFWSDGQPTDDPHFRLARSNRYFIAYCKLHSFNIGDFVTGPDEFDG